MFKLPFKYRYRVLEIKKGSGTSIFYPQERYRFIFWKGMRSSNSAIDLYRSTYDEANKYLYSLYKEEHDMKVVGKEVHAFNEVFHKLKND